MLKNVNDTLRGFFRWKGPKELMDAARRQQQPREKGQVQRRHNRYDYTAGPMLFLGQQIVRAMQDAGYPARIHCHYRTAEQQAKRKAEGTSRADAWGSPHQYYEAVDIVHASKYWRVSDDFWETLAVCARVVSEKYDVPLELGHDWGWDSAHIELKDWRTFRDKIRQRWLTDYADWNNSGKHGQRPEPTPPTPQELWQRFGEVLPAVQRAYLARKNREPFTSDSDHFGR